MSTAATSLTPRDLAKVASVLSAVGADPCGELTASLLSGGRSNLTYVLTDGTSRWVLRTPPRSGRIPSAHDVAREFRVTAALAQTAVPVAEAVAICEDDSILGLPFMVSSFVDGRAYRSQADVAALDDHALAAVVDSIVTSLVELHSVDYAAVGLEDFGRADNYAARQLRRWRGQWEIVGTEGEKELAAEVVRALERNLPPQRRASIVHGDYRVDNTLVAGGDAHPRVAAIVDWELSTIGDPVADVAMMCAYRDPAFDLIVGEPSAWTSSRLPGPEGLAEKYVASSDLELEHWEFHQALAYFKVAVIAAGIDHRRRAGSGNGAGFDTAGESVPRFMDLAHRITARL